MSAVVFILSGWFPPPPHPPPSNVNYMKGVPQFTKSVLENHLFLPEINDGKQRNLIVPFVGGKIGILFHVFSSSSGKSVQREVHGRVAEEED